ncbi:hypothetical protein DRQ07_09305 [candidate division KSB1 bacterium]|nr:MAG: hypothetical protein DRQ07_09305 [candidate division KSB1 bacterium]
MKIGHIDRSFFFAVETGVNDHSYEICVDKNGKRFYVEAEHVRNQSSKVREKWNELKQRTEEVKKLYPDRSIYLMRQSIVVSERV